MTNKKTQSLVTNLATGIASLLAWVAGYIVMQIVYDSIAASIVFGTTIAVMVFFECRLSYLSLKSDGRIEITKEEIKSNLWQIVAAIIIALLLSIPLLLKIYETDIIPLIGTDANSLTAYLCAFTTILPSLWLPVIAFCLGVIVIFLIPIIIQMTAEEKSNSAKAK